MKTCLDTRTSQKTLEGESEWHPNTEVSGIQEPIQQFWRAERHFWSAEWHFKSAEFTSFGLWPNGLGVTIRHTFFTFSQKDVSEFKP